MKWLQETVKKTEIFITWNGKKYDHCICYWDQDSGPCKFGMSQLVKKKEGIERIRNWIWMELSCGWRSWFGDLELLYRRFQQASSCKIQLICHKICPENYVTCELKLKTTTTISLCIQSFLLIFWKNGSIKHYWNTTQKKICDGEIT